MVRLPQGLERARWSQPWDLRAYRHRDGSAPASAFSGIAAARGYH